LLAGHLYQPGDPGCGIPPQGKGIAATIGDMPEDGIDRFQSGQFFQKDPAVANGQILTFNQRIAHITGKQGLFEIYRAFRARREKNDMRIFTARGGSLHHAVVKGSEKRSQSPDLGLMIEFREDP